MKNCVYDDGSVVTVEDSVSCPLTHQGHSLVDETTLHTSVSVRSLDPLWVFIAVIGLGFLFSRKR